MVAHAYLNVMLIMFLISGFENPNPAQPWWQTVFLDPGVLGLIFALSFVIHELSHLYTGKHFQFQSRFCLTKVGVKSTIKAAKIGIPMGLPGAAISVGVDPVKDRDKMGWIKFAGPTSNLVFGLVLLLLGYLVPTSIMMLKLYVLQGASLNFVLGAFNMIPIAIKGFALDGEYIVKWKKGLYFTLFSLLIFLLFVAMIIYQNAYLL
jgi:Zn-dependent protease